jgi:hypothetical protein
MEALKCLANRNRIHQLVGMTKVPSILLTAGLLAGPMASAEVKLSEKLNRIAAHLGDGGVHFAVTDSQDDLKNLGEVIDEVIKVIPDADVPPGFKVTSLIENLGLLSVQGSGESSKKVGNLWHNRSFVLTDGKHEGLLSLLGRKATASGASDFAPSGADLVLETSLDLRQMEKLARKVSKMFGPEAEQETKGALMEALPGMGMTLAEMFTDFSVRGTMVFWLDEKETFDLGPEASFPVPHFAARLEGSEVLWTFLKNTLGEESVLKKVGDEVILAPKDGVEEVPWGLVDPRFVWNAKTKQLFFSLSDVDLAACRGEGVKLSADADFKKATVGFPEKTNGLAYVSSEFLQTLIGIGGVFTEEIPEEGEAVFGMMMGYLKEVADKGGYAGAFSVEEDGFLFVANTPLAMKGGGSGLAGIASVATLAGIATPLIVRAQKTADDTVNANLLKMYAGAQNIYRVEKGSYANHLRELVAADILTQEDAAELSAMGMESLVDGNTKFDDAEAILAYLPSVKDPEKVVVARVDGSSAIISFEKFKEQLRKQSQ